MTVTQRDDYRAAFEKMPATASVIPVRDVCQARTAAESRTALLRSFVSNVLWQTSQYSLLFDLIRG